jgi:hypothetical protein
MIFNHYYPLHYNLSLTTILTKLELVFNHYYPLHYNLSLTIQKHHDMVKFPKY